MKWILSILLFSLAVVTALAEVVEVRTKDHVRFYGEIIGKQGDVIFLQAKNTVISFHRSQVSDVIRENHPITFGVFRQEDFIDPECQEAVTYESLQRDKHNDARKAIEKAASHPQLRRSYLIPISLLSGALAVDYFIDASDLDLSIAHAEGETRSDLKEKRTRKYIMGGICTIVAIVNTAFALDQEPVQVYSDGEYIGMSLRY